METDTSASAVGISLAHKQNGLVKPVQYAIRALNSAERNYYACDMEEWAVILPLRNFRIYLLSSQPFELITDLQALPYDFEKKEVYV